MADLYPVFDVDEEDEFDEEEEIEYLQDYKFNFTTGEFVTGSNDIMKCNGAEAWLQWCQSMLHIERYDCLAYPDDMGVELEECIGLPDKQDAQLQIKTTITEALLSDPEGRTESVEDFSFYWDSDSVYVECVVESTTGIVAAIGTEYSNKRGEDEIE